MTREYDIDRTNSNTLRSRDRREQHGYRSLLH